MKAGLRWGVLFLVFLFVLFITQLQMKNALNDLEALLLFGFLFLLVNKIFLENGKLHTSSAAIIMSFGIFMNGVSRHFSLLNDSFGKMAALA
ncbi:MAG TPA: hypothetical protein VFK27_04335, partial [Bacillales bacterium]|nr:hypothetical protein [Bacillales bacterium]